MQVTQHVHALKIPFQLPFEPGKTIERSVYAYVILGERITLVDSGVSGSEDRLFDYIEKQGRKPEEVALLILSHAHPDHIGAAKAIRAATGCVVAAHEAERNWIEDPETQFKERPVPGFHTLVGGPVVVDKPLTGGEKLDLGVNLDAFVMHTPGHSRGSISLYLAAEKALFSGDALILPGDLPIYENIVDCVASIEALRRRGGVETLLSSWEPPIQGQGAIQRRMEESIALLKQIHEAVLEGKLRGNADPMDLCAYVVRELGLPPAAANPLVAKGLASSLRAGGPAEPFHS